MAWKTRTLARETKDVATATANEAEAVEKQGEYIAKQAQASADALRATVLPWLTWLPERETTRPPSATFFNPELADEKTYDPGLELRDSINGDGVEGGIWVRNVGTGIALIDTFNSWVNGGRRHQRYVKLRTAKPVLPSGEATRLSFHVSKTSAAWTDMTVDKFTEQPGGGSFSLDVYFQDVAKTTTYRARFHAQPTSYQAGWAVAEIDYWDGNSDEPIAVALDVEDR